MTRSPHTKNEASDVLLSNNRSSHAPLPGAYFSLVYVGRCKGRFLLPRACYSNVACARLGEQDSHAVVVAYQEKCR